MVCICYYLLLILILDQLIYLLPCLYLDDTPVILDQDLKPQNHTKTLTHKKEKNSGIIAECELRVKRQKMSIEHEKKMNYLQVNFYKLTRQFLMMMLVKYYLLIILDFKSKTSNVRTSCKENR